MRNAGILISALCVAAGIVVGRLQYENERDAAASEEAPGVYDPGIATAPDSAAATTGRASRRRASVDPSVLPADDVAEEVSAPGSTSEVAGGQPSNNGSSRAAGAPPTGEVEAIRGLLDRQEFAAASTAAEQLAARLPEGSPARAEVLRLAAKARVFRDLIDTIDTGKGPPDDGMKELKLANGNTVLASSVEKRDDRYEVELATGGSFAPLVEDVLEIKPASREKFLEDEWSRLEPKIARVDNAIDLFVHGVQDCYRHGMKAQGHRLLERLLAMPDSDSIPLVFIPGADEEDLLAWRVAAGRLDPAAARRALEEPARARPSAAAAALGPGAVGEAARLLREAEDLYRNAARKEGRESELVAARTRLDEALEILESLPPDDEVIKLRRQLSTLLHDVVRSLPF